MNISKINDNNIKEVAEFMADIKSDWWDYQGALNQLRTGIGWCIGEEKIKGWLLCKDLRVYKTVEIECLGYSVNDEFIIGGELSILIEKCEQWAKDKNYKNLRFIIGSSGTSCHKPVLKEIWQELRDIKSIDSKEYDWFIRLGFEPNGILPNIYGDGNHGIVLVKKI